jgi:acyl carrier protein
MERKEILEKLKEILKGSQFLFVHDQIEAINENTSLIYDLVMDSIQILELLVTVEEEFGLTCRSDEFSVDLFDKVSNLIDFIEAKLSIIKG